jgi:hypothetical protein
MKRRNDEEQVQKLLVRWLDNHNVHYVASLMGVNLGVRVGAIRKAMGCKAGVPDIIILMARGNYFGMTLELKVKGGHITPEQEQFRAKSYAEGYCAVIMPINLEPMDALNWAIKEVTDYLNGNFDDV